MINFKKGVKDISAAVISNVIVSAVSIVMSLIVPIFLTIEDYGYWQINVLYGGYVGFLHLGWIDGLYIKYVGRKYEELDKRDFQSQFFSLVIFEVAISVIAIIAVIFMTPDLNKAIVLGAVFLSAVISIPRGMLLFILQATSRIKEYSISNCVGRIVYLIIGLILLMIGKRSFITLLVANLAGLFCSIACAILYCRDIVFCKQGKYSYRFKETIDDIKCGSKITIAYLAGTTIVGLVKAIIEMRWELSDFSMVSFAVSISSVIMILINAIGTVILPIIKNTEQDKIKPLYLHMSKIMTYLLPLSLLLYYPVRVIVLAYLPKYAQGIELLAVLFPICVFECKMGLTNNTFLKALRKENSLLFINLISVALTAILSIIAAYVIENYLITIMVMVIMIAVRCIMADIVLSKYIKANIISDILVVLISSTIFIFLNCSFSFIVSLLLFCVWLAVLIVTNIKQLKTEARWLLRIIVKK